MKPVYKNKERSVVKSVMNVLFAVLFNLMVSIIAIAVMSIVYHIEVPLLAVFVPVMFVAFILGYIKHKQPKVYSNSGLAFAGLIKEVWISRIMEKFYAEFPYLEYTEDMTQFVDNDAINLADSGVNPDVLINNTTYPIPTVTRDDAPISIPLDNYDTKNTIVRRIESIGLAYNKIDSIIRGHKNTLAEKSGQKFTHAYGALSDGAYTPVLNCSGADRGDGTKKMMTIDIINMQKIFDKLKVPQKGRVLVLSPDHIADLLQENWDKYKSIADLESGKIMNLYGFMIFKGILNPTYNKTTLVKNAFGAAPASTDCVSSLVWHAAEVMRADGSVEMFYTPRNINTSERGDVIGFAKRAIGLPIRGKYYGAIVSGQA